MLPELAAILLLIGLAAYVVLGGADFGAGFWDLTAGGPERGAPVRAMIKRAMSPVWEANHVWLIFVLVVLWTAFPEAFGSIMSTLAIPLFVAALGIVLRGGAFALKGEAATIGEARALGATFALSSVVTPFFLGAAAGVIAAGEVPVGNAAGDEWGSWTGALPILTGLIAVATGAHLAAVFLGADARRAGRPPPGPPLPVRGARARAAVGAIVAGWALAQEPYLLPPGLTVEEAAAPDESLLALLIAAAIGMALLVPALVWLFRLALSGRLAYEEEPRP